MHTHHALPLWEAIRPAELDAIASTRPSASLVDGTLLPTPVLMVNESPDRFDHRWPPRKGGFPERGDSPGGPSSRLPYGAAARNRADRRGNPRLGPRPPPRRPRGRRGASPRWRGPPDGWVRRDRTSARSGL